MYIYENQYYVNLQRVLDAIEKETTFIPETVEERVSKAKVFVKDVNELDIKCFNIEELRFAMNDINIADANLEKYDGKIEDYNYARNDRNCIEYINNFVSAFIINAIKDKVFSEGKLSKSISDCRFCLEDLSSFVIDETADGYIDPRTYGQFNYSQIESSLGLVNFLENNMEDLLSLKKMKEGNDIE